MKIYVVTQGEYSDYHIVTTFLDKNVANDFANKMNSRIKGYSQEFVVEEYDILSSIDEYKPNKELLEITYRSDTKKISCENKNVFYGDERIGKDIYFYDEGFYIAIMNVELTVSNVLKSEKMIMDWVRQIEYELQNTFNGDLKLYKKHYKNIPF